jgi:NAD-dependent SIR2 family protein deacetylase
MTMDADELHTDANGVAGLMQEVFAVDFTRLVRRCQSCGDRRESGALRSYAGAGTVLRCANCGDVAVRVVVQPEAHVFELRGTWTVVAGAR